MESRIWISVGNVKRAINKEDSAAYAFNMITSSGTDLLPNVTVVGKYKKKVEQYDDYYSSGPFKRDEAMIFDGIEDETMACSMSILRFLEGKVPGLIIEKDQETMVEMAQRVPVGKMLRGFVTEHRAEPQFHRSAGADRRSAHHPERQQGGGDESRERPRDEHRERRRDRRPRVKYAPRGRPRGRRTPR